MTAQGRPGPPLGPDHPERQALPNHLRAAASALFDELPASGPAAEAALARLAAGAAELTDRLGPGPSITVDAFRVRAAATCAATTLSEDAEPFAWTPASAARTLGLRAVAFHLRGDGIGPNGPPVETAADAVVAELMAHGGERTPGPWLAGLTPAGRAAALAQARRWAEQAVAWLPLRLVARSDLRFLDDDWWPPRPRGSTPPAGRALVVHGRRDITVDVGGRKVAVTVAGGTASGPGHPDVDALTALAAVLGDARRRLVRVVRVHPASGEVAAVDVTTGLVERGVEVVLATAATLGRLAEPDASPGPACTWCRRRAVCAPGAAWLARPDRRSMGLPLLAVRV